MAVAEDLGSYYRVRPGVGDLNYAKFFDQVKVGSSHGIAHTPRHNASGCSRNASTLSGASIHSRVREGQPSRARNLILLLC